MGKFTKKQRPSVLYHFTSTWHLKQISKHGICRGDVATSPNGGFNAPWLTTDPDRTNQRWARGSCFDKTAVRLRVDIPMEERGNLRHWPDLAKGLRIKRAWMAGLKRGGNANNWYLYLGHIPPEWILDIDIVEDWTAQDPEPTVVDMAHDGVSKPNIGVAGQPFASPMPGITAYCFADGISTPFASTKGEDEQ